MSRYFMIVLACILFSCTARSQDAVTADVPQGAAVATFAGGCFWCMEPPFDALDGVHSTTSGFMGGHVPDPTYDQVSRGGTGHAEVVQVVYDPEVVTYERLLEVFWRNIDPVAVDRQFCDIGDQYRSAIFYHSDAQRDLADASRERLAESGRFDRPIATEIAAAGEFFAAEAYHQNFYRTSPRRYRQYRTACGRDARLNEIWGQ